MAPYPRVRGRYSSSEMYAIMNDWITPETWMKGEERDITALMKMWKGIAGHDQIQFLLEKEYCEVKKVFEYKGIKLVAKADYLPDGQHADEVWEFKTHETVLDKSKKWHDYQVKLYTSIFQRERGVILQPVETPTRVLLKKIGEVKRNDTWFVNQLEKLLEFNKEVEKLWEQKK